MRADAHRGRNFEVTERGNLPDGQTTAVLLLGRLRHGGRRS